MLATTDEDSLRSTGYRDAIDSQLAVANLADNCETAVHENLASQSRLVATEVAAESTMVDWAAMASSITATVPSKTNAMRLPNNNVLDNV